MKYGDKLETGRISRSFSFQSVSEAKHFHAQYLICVRRAVTTADLFTHGNVVILDAPTREIADALTKILFQN